MKIFSKAFTLAIVALLALIAFRLYATKAEPKPPQFWTPGCVATIPKAWTIQRRRRTIGPRLRGQHGHAALLDQHSMRRNSDRRSRSSPQHGQLTSSVGFSLRHRTAAFRSPLLGSDRDFVLFSSTAILPVPT